MLEEIELNFPIDTSIYLNCFHLFGIMYCFHLSNKCRLFGCVVGMGGILTWTVLLATFVNGVLCQQNSRDGYEGVLVPSQVSPNS